MRSKIATGCAAGGVLLCLSGPSFAGFTTIAHEIIVDDADREVHFTLHFNQTPDFQTVDEAGEFASAFQIFIDPSPSEAGFNYDETAILVRGLNVQPNNVLSVWDFNGIDGFGELRGKVPLEIGESWVRFVASFDTINDQDGRFDYRVESYSYGELTDLREGTTHVVPLPAAIWSGLTMFTAGGVLRLRRRMKA